MSARRALPSAVLVALLGFAVFAPSLWPGELLSYEDDHFLPGSPAICHARIAQILDPRASREDLGAEYLPVRDLTYALDAQLWGTRTDDGRGLDLTTRRAAVGIRFTNLVIYAIACGLACVFVRELTGDPLLALLAGAFFAVHPVHAESAAWVSSRKDVLSGALGFAALIFFMRARRASGRRAATSFGTSVLLSLLAMLSKSTLTALPFLVGLVELGGPLVRRERARITGFSPENDDQGLFASPGLSASPGHASPPGGIVRRALVVAPYFLVAGLVAWNAIEVGKHTGIAQPARAGGLVTVIATDLPILVRYIAACAWPVDLRVTYGVFYFHFTLAEPVVARCVPLLLAVLGLTVGAIWRRPRLVGFAVLWAILALIPVLNFIPFVQILADRYLFLPVLGWALVLAWALTRARRFRATPLIAALLLLAYAVLGVTRGLDFATSEALFQSNLALEPENALAHHQLGRAHLARAESAARGGDHERAAALAERAVIEERAAIVLYHRPEVMWAGHLEEAQHSLARALELEGRREQAVAVERAALVEAAREAAQASARPDATERAREQLHEARQRLATFAIKLVARARRPDDAPLALEAARAFLELPGDAGRAHARDAVTRARALDPAVVATTLAAEPALAAVARDP